MAGEGREERSAGTLAGAAGMLETLAVCSLVARHDCA